jgi:hypothetical protein
VAATVAKSPEYTVAFLYSTLPATVDHASQSPASLDLMLQVYVQATSWLPTHVSSDNGKGPKEASGDLNWRIAEEAGCFNPPPQHGHAGTSPVADVSNTRFSESEVRERMSDVLDRVREWSEWRESRVKWTIMAAAMGRCYALNLMWEREGKTAIALMDTRLNV